MPYTHYTTDERNALQAMEGMALPKSYISVILGKRQSSIYRELNRNGTNGVYTGNEAQALSVQRRLETKPSPKLDDPALTREIKASVSFHNTGISTRGSLLVSPKNRRSPVHRPCFPAPRGYGSCSTLSLPLCQHCSLLLCRLISQSSRSPKGWGFTAILIDTL